MTTFNATKYNKSFIWKGNDYLVNPETAAKRCACCKKLWYSQEYAESDEFDDHKYPVCNRCSRKKKNAEKITKLIEPLGVTKECKKCGEAQSIHNFVSRSSDWIIINIYCDNCRTMPKDKIPV